ncbi:unnamed protein product [Penicillium nalgiovense]|nr:unnamed protein product [Penicillium nalgiovense]CAG8180487.1 unnamed protein product [Penicillium nalgiovense]
MRQVHVTIGNLLKGSDIWSLYFPKYEQFKAGTILIHVYFEIEELAKNINDKWLYNLPADLCKQC